MNNLTNLTNCANMSSNLADANLGCFIWPQYPKGGIFIGIILIIIILLLTLNYIFKKRNI
jgi:hypothetical protein